MLEGGCSGARVASPLSHIVSRFYLSQDPPLYFDEILWPSHLKAHAHLFENQDVESGQLVPSESGTKPLQVIEAQDPPGKGSPKKIDDIIKQGCEALLSSLSHWQQQHEQKGSVS